MCNSSMAFYLMVGEKKCIAKSESSFAHQNIKPGTWMNPKNKLSDSFDTRYPTAKRIVLNGTAQQSAQVEWIRNALELTTKVELMLHFYWCFFSHFISSKVKLGNRAFWLNLWPFRAMLHEMWLRIPFENCHKYLIHLAKLEHCKSNGRKIYGKWLVAVWMGDGGKDS